MHSLVFIWTWRTGKYREELSGRGFLWWNSWLRPAVFSVYPLQFVCTTVYDSVQYKSELNIIWHSIGIVEEVLGQLVRFFILWEFMFLHCNCNNYLYTTFQTLQIVSELRLAIESVTRIWKSNWKLEGFDFVRKQVQPKI